MTHVGITTAAAITIITACWIIGEIYLHLQHETPRRRLTTTLLFAAGLITAITITLARNL